MVKGGFIVHHFCIYNGCGVEKIREFSLPGATMKTPFLIYNSPFIIHHPVLPDTPPKEGNALWLGFCVD